MIRRLSGVVHGKTNELREDPGIADGEYVEVTIKPSDGSPNWGDGIRRSAGAAADIPDFDTVFALIQEQRKSAPSQPRAYRRST
ncbi:MAG: hypothetical protein KDA72_04650 [Planctomycetales bacterium]|nr:hypothetical protein [Planctomycetales bacterium]